MKCALLTQTLCDVKHFILGFGIYVLAWLAPMLTELRQPSVSSEDQLSTLLNFLVHTNLNHIFHHRGGEGYLLS